MYSYSHYDVNAKIRRIINDSPHSIFAERGVIACMLLDKNAWERIADVVSVNDFYLDKHRRIFRHICDLLEKGLEADVLSVSQSIANANEAELASVFADLTEIANYSGPVSNIRRYAIKVRREALLRMLITAANNFSDSVLNSSGYDIERIIDAVDIRLQKIAEYGAPLLFNQSAIQPLLVPVVEGITEHYGTESTPRTPSGFSDFDNLTFGLKPGDLIVLAGRPAMGKTTLALNIAEHVGLELKLPVSFFSLGESGQQLAQRLLSSVSGIDQSTLNSGNLTDGDWDKMTTALKKLHESIIDIEETPSFCNLALCDRVRRLSREHGKLGLVVIDSLDLMIQAHKDKKSTLGVSDILRSIKFMAKHLDVPIIVLSKLSHRGEARNDKRPLLGDLSNKSAIEQYADLIVMLHREEYYNNRPENKGIAEAIIRMNRNGLTGTVKLNFLSEYPKFTNI